MNYFSDWSHRIKFLGAVWKRMDFFSTGLDRSAYVAWEGEWDGKDGAW